MSKLTEFIDTLTEDELQHMADLSKELAMQIMREWLIQLLEQKERDETLTNPVRS